MFSSFDPFSAYRPDTLRLPVLDGTSDSKNPNLYYLNFVQIPQSQLKMQFQKKLFEWFLFSSISFHQRNWLGY